MSETIFASFEDDATARSTINSLIESGIPADDISYACKTHDMATAETKRREGIDHVDQDATQDMGAMPLTFPDLRAVGPGGLTLGDTVPGAMGTRFAGIAATSSGSTSPGEMTEYLWDSLPSDLAPLYRQEYDGGKAILVVRNPKPDTEVLLRGKGAQHLQSRGYLA